MSVRNFNIIGYPAAINMAHKVIELKPNWWVGHQTLGRVHLGLGEVRMVRLIRRHYCIYGRMGIEQAHER